MLFSRNSLPDACAGEANVRFADIHRALYAIQQEWTSPLRSYEDRFRNLTNQQPNADVFDDRANGCYVLIHSSSDPTNYAVFDDGCADVLTGSAGLDWFFFNQPDDSDRGTDLKDEVFANDLDWISAR